MNLKKYRILIIGYGSMGRKHAKVLKSMGVKDLFFYSKQKNIPYMRINNLNDVRKIDPHYIIISSNTTDHYQQLNLLEKKIKNKTILIEKPLFAKYKKMKTKYNKIFVGYNLRFHPIIQFIKNKIKTKKIWSASVICGSYLPNWRNNRNYYNSHSAKKKYGGGVLLELSHEIDYFLWFFNNFQIENVFNKKISNLQINTDDVLDLVGKNKNVKYISIKLNYFFRSPMRKIFIDGNDISINADLIKNSLSIVENNIQKKHSWPKFTNLDTYRSLHKHILNKNYKFLCKYNDGLKVIKLIDQIKNYKN
jgi:CMP-N,N'-diacetyllegionaminic acid synthase